MKVHKIHNIAVKNRDTYVHVISTSVSNVLVSFVMSVINQHPAKLLIKSSTKIKYDYGKYCSLRLANPVMWPKVTGQNDNLHEPVFELTCMKVDTVKPVLKATCIKQSPAFKGHYFRSH